MSENDPLNSKHDVCYDKSLSTTTSRINVTSSSMYAENPSTSSPGGTIYQPVMIFPLPSQAFPWVFSKDSDSSPSIETSSSPSVTRGSLEYSSIVDIPDRDDEDVVEQDIQDCRNNVHEFLHSFKSQANVRHFLVSVFAVTVFISLYLSFMWSPLTLRAQEPREKNVPLAKCHAGAMNDPETQMPFKTWTSDNGIKLPYYSTGDLDVDKQTKITRAVVIQHGFLRNANQYYCAAYDALMALDELQEEGAPSFENTIVMAPQFISNGDLCWDPENDPTTPQVTDLDASPPVDCGLPVWYVNQSWVNGQLNSNPISSFGFPAYIYSYDVFNLMIDRLSDPIYFPDLKNITLFGFSAGGQTMQRYAIKPKYIEREHVHVRFVISDPSGFAYFDDRRPRTDGSEEFGVPKPDESEEETLPPGKVRSKWIPKQWARTMTENQWLGGADDLGAGAIPVETLGQSKSNTKWGKKGTGIGMLVGEIQDWIPSWEGGLCYQFNEWRMGLKDLDGYLLQVQNEGDLQQGIKSYIRKDITYMIGWQDTCNCNLGNTSYNTHICYYADFNGNNGNCDDNMLEEECGSMLQGSNRYLRMINWLKYLEVFYGKKEVEENPRRLVKANVGHDYVRMIRSVQGACVIYGWSCHTPGVMDVASVTPGIYEKDEYRIKFTPGPSYPAFPVPDEEKWSNAARNSKNYDDSVKSVSVISSGISESVKHGHLIY